MDVIMLAVMNYMADGISFEAKMGDGSKPEQGFFGKLLEGAKRKVTGESLFLTHFTNTGTGAKRVAFAAPYPGKIMALDLGRMGGELTCQKDAFWAAVLGTEVGITFTKRLGMGFFGGEGLFLATLRGQGTVWLQTLPFSRLADRIIAHAPRSGGKSRGEGLVLGGLGDLFGDR
jgi:uncharacterized protein (AIM24 family)